MKIRIINLLRYYCSTEYQYMRRKVNNRKQRLIMYILFFPICLIHFPFSFIWVHTIQRIKTRISIRRESRESFDYELIIAAIAKNEALYIEEWLQYHEKMGVNKVLLFDNESTDDIKTILQPYCDKGFVEYMWIPGRARQLDAYNIAINQYRKKCKYMAFIDIDEFIVPSHNEDILSAVKEIMNQDEYASGIAMNWKIFGSSNRKDKPDGLVVENYLYRAKNDDPVNRCVKTIVNPRMIRGYVFSPHAPSYYSGTYAISDCGDIIIGPWNDNLPREYGVISVHHYYCKSEQEGKIKLARGLATHEKMTCDKWDEYLKNDRNEVYDDEIIRFINHHNIAKETDK